MAYLRLREVAKSYDGKTNAVDDVSIDIERGEFVTFLGPSGSGKTTTLHDDRRLRDSDRRRRSSSADMI